MVKTRSMMNNNSAPVELRRSERLRARAVPTYKSIIRTRSQKAKERAVALELMFKSARDFYSKHQREPYEHSEDMNEKHMAFFLKSLRATIADGKLTERAVKNQLPWFTLEIKHWDNRSFRLQDILLMTVLFAVLPATLLGAQYYSMHCMHDSSCNDAVVAFGQRTTANIVGVYMMIDYQLYMAGRQIYTYGRQFLTV